jgi:hypothetical protein
MLKKDKREAEVERLKCARQSPPSRRQVKHRFCLKEIFILTEG